MKNLYNFEKIIYCGNVNRDFYLFCCKKNKKLLIYVFIHLFYSFLGLFSLKCYYLKRKKYFVFLKKCNNVETLFKEFGKLNKKKISQFYINKNKKNDVIISYSPKKIVNYLIDNQNVYAPQFDEKYNLIIKDFEINDDFNEIYINRFSDKSKYNGKNIFVKKFNAFILCKNKKNTKIIITILKYLLPIFLGILLLLITFEFTTVFIELKRIYYYVIDIKLMLLNLFPIVLLIYLFWFITKKLWISFSFVSFLVFLIGIINKTKLYYRDDIFKFEDILLFKEALTMTSRYDIIINWYVILSIILIIIIILFLKRFVSKIKFKYYVIYPIIILLITIGVISYNKIYTNATIYNSVGNLADVNVWIATRQSQVRGLIYPFIYSSTEMTVNPPDGYSEEKVKEILDDYDYSDIEEDKKVNIIAIMLEAYNDFTKFDSINFTEDVYEQFHEIKGNSLYGELIVNVFGGGTATTERMFITGFYNFPTFRKPTNSYAQYFKEQGYLVEAMHPIYGSFYNRNTVNLNLGFENYWNYDNKFKAITENFLEDEEFYQYIIEGLQNANDSGKKYFNFSVTYQNHGPYTTTPIENNFIEKENYSDNAYNMFNTYLNGIKSSNEALYNLVDFIDNYNEPTIIILFGDHNPYLGENNYVYQELGINMDVSTEEGFTNYYGTPFVIHANDEAKKVFDKEFVGDLGYISPNFLMNEFFEYVGYEGNEYTQFTNDVKEYIDVINPIYYEEDEEFVPVQASEYTDLMNEFWLVNFYWMTNFKEK